MNKLEFFWETEYKFAKYLESIFSNYQRKYSLNGNGIYNLITLNGRLYEIKYSQAKNFPLDDNYPIAADKKEIIDIIVSNFKKDVKYSITNGKIITFTVGSWIAKVEIIKKLKMPN